MTGQERRRSFLSARLSASPLGVKLALLSAFVTATVVGLAFLALRARAEADVRRVFVAELEASQHGLKQEQDRNLRLLLATSSLVSTSPTLRAALQEWRRERDAGLPVRKELVATIRSSVQDVFTDLDRDLLVVTDDSGRVLTAIGREAAPRPGDDFGRMPAVRYALSADRATADSSFGVLRMGTRPLQVGCVAILVDGFPTGALVLGERLDRLMPRPDTASGTQAVVTAGSVVLMSTLDRSPVGATWSAPALSAGAETQRVRLGDEEYISASVPLGLTDDGRPATLHVLRSLTASLEPIASSLGRSFVLAGVLAVLVVGGGAAVVSRRTLRPLSRFVAFMRAGADASAEGSAFTRFDEPHASIEIRTLTDAYNRLIDSLRRQHAQLEQRGVELATTNESLTQQVRERERAEHALRESEEQLRQSQKLESLGTLAGGVAHDFNNLLSVILGYAHLSSENASAGSRNLDDLGQITDAANRASILVRQLLAFSRKQVLQPQIVDLNRIVTGVQSLLRPLLGEDVHLRTQLAPRLARIKADPGQLEQVIVNLAVNARDAMPTGGALVIETANVQSEVLDGSLGTPRGAPQVMLEVRDTGVGMDAATRDRIFEPFFTTKAPGKGTGLGLSTVYGIVRQSEGTITVHTEPGQGCAIRCFFPATDEVKRQSGETAELPDVAGGTETLLVAEDEEQLRALVRRYLGTRGYTILEARDGREAIDVAQSHKGPIHLFVTDVVMPHMSGKELAMRLQQERPGLRVLFISGYSSEAIERHGELAPDSVFLQKPIQPVALARAVREILDDEPATHGRG